MQRRLNFFFFEVTLMQQGTVSVYVNTDIQWAHVVGPVINYRKVSVLYVCVHFLWLDTTWYNSTYSCYWFLHWFLCLGYNFLNQEKGAWLEAIRYTVISLMFEGSFFTGKYVTVAHSIWKTMCRSDSACVISWRKDSLRLKGGFP